MILLDSNQASMDVELKNHLEKHVDILVTPLDTSDLFFVGKINGTQIKVGMELKKAPSDLMASLRDGRLMTQLPRMTQEFDMPYLVTIGEAEKIDFTEGKVQEKIKGGKWNTSNFSYHYLNSIIARFEASGGRVRHVRDTAHLVAFILSELRFWEKENHTEEVFYKKRHKFLDWKLLDNPLMEMYERMGIGIKRAGVLAETYPTLKSLAYAEKKDLMGLEGFGKKTAEKVMEFING